MRARDEASDNTQFACCVFQSILCNVYIIYRVFLWYHMLLLFIVCSLCFTNPASWLPSFQYTFVLSCLVLTRLESVQLVGLQQRLSHYSLVTSLTLVFIKRGFYSSTNNVVRCMAKLFSISDEFRVHQSWYRPTST